MTKQVIRSAGERLKMCSRISEQRLKVSPLMIMGDETARDARTSIRCDWHPDHKQACKPDTADLRVRSARLAHK